jgi:hypothetical protein
MNPLPRPLTTMLMPWRLRSYNMPSLICIMSPSSGPITRWASYCCIATSVVGGAWEKQISRVGESAAIRVCVFGLVGTEQILKIIIFSKHNCF